MRGRLEVRLLASFLLVLTMAGWASAGFAWDLRATDAFVPDQLIVRFDAARHEQIDLVAQAIGAGSYRNLFHGDIWLLELPQGSDVRAAARLVAGLAGVKYAHPNMIVAGADAPNDPSFALQWGFQQTTDADIDAPEAWSLRTDASQMVVAVIDTGTQYTHPDLVANIWTNPGEIPNNGLDDDGNGYVDDVHGYDWVNLDGDPSDDNGHGTHCSGTLGACSDNGLGVAGTCWKVQIMVLKFLGATGSGSIANAILAVEYALDNGAHLLSNSWGCYCSANDVQGLRDAVAAAGEAGLLFVAAAGNASQDNDQVPYYPASFALPSVFSIAASNPSDGRASFSNWGAHSVHLAAPGESIYSTWISSAYMYSSGTSMACPHAAGAVALVAAQCPAATLVEVKQHIMDTADPSPAFTGLIASNGRLNLRNALLACPPPVEVSVIAPHGGELYFGSGTSVQWSTVDPEGAVHHVVIRLQSGDGDDLGVIADGEADDGQFDWDLAAVADGSYRLRIDAVGAGGELLGSGISDAAFRVDRSTSVLVTSPNGGDRAHGALDILWSATDPDGEIDHIALFLQDEDGWDLVALSEAEENDGLCTWETSSVPDGQYGIRVEARNALDQALGSDVSDGLFRIDNATTVQVIAPNGGEHLSGSASVRWTTEDPYGEIASIAIWLQDPSGADLRALASGEPDDGLFAWDLGSIAMGSYRIAIRALDAEGIVVAEDRSDAPFTVKVERLRIKSP
jgi:hypothetical protein